ncbi:MAG: AmmeMemoRadiSam system radical SAM enzyme [Omnitrophica WOR_2 bacterium RIFCSPLOWO2_12_FULL_51_8]|nr:MAG: AmmeMemoRadiSam system radical SAM enzyme [Omnitrophica WOR_2 bacterium RIFCSPLOWO2_12_FULL_51_8]
MREALLYEKLDDRRCHCFLCAHHCLIAPQKLGVCGVRENIDGTLYALTYGKVIARHADPVEKKPLYHFLSGSFSFSIAAIGCNFKCGFCQNWEISQSSFRGGAVLSGEEIPPQEIVRQAIDYKCRSISYTYTEPTIFFEFALDAARLAKAAGLYNIFVTNGYMSKAALEMIRPYLDAANVDLKFFRDSSYHQICGAALDPVLESIRLMHQLGVWVEVTTLVIPGENDSSGELGDIAGFIAGVDKNIPWHISAFHPDYKFIRHKATSDAALKTAMDLGRKAGLTYIYAGNVSGWGNDTYCAGCGKMLIKRDSLRVLENNLKEGKCAFCQAAVPGVFEGGGV